jgi:nicotinate-nucleotide adenylyltransferase
MNPVRKFSKEIKAIKNSSNANLAGLSNGVKIGILGGTFNPIHNGHLTIAEYVRKEFKLSKVIFIPCNIPYHKKSLKLLPSDQRLDMVKIAVKENKFFEASDIDIKRGGLTYSIDTLKELKSVYSNKDSFYFIIGMDSLIELPLWREIKTLAKLCRFIVVKRPGFNKRRMQSFLSPRIFYSDAPLVDISSSEIRNKVKRKQPLKNLVLDSIIKYIKKHSLFS